MKRQLPKNVRQIGNVSDSPKVYMEDYVDTFLNQCNGSDKPMGAVLVGEIVQEEEQDYVYITGAVKINELDTKEGTIGFTEEEFQKVKEDCKEYFPQGKMVGWFLFPGDLSVKMEDGILQLQEMYFPEANTLFVIRRQEEQEEQIYTYKYHDLMLIGGYYIFYEKNPDMQNYMVSRRDQTGITPSEIIEDKAAKSFRDIVQEKTQLQEQKKSSRFMYMASAFLVLVVLVIGVTMINNYDRMKAVQSSLEVLSENVGGETKEQKESVQTEGKEKEPDKEPEATAEEQKEPQTTDATNGVSEDDYYVVQKGDTLAKISRKIYGDSSHVEAICKMNGLSDDDLIFIGQKLLLP